MDVIIFANSDVTMKNGVRLFLPSTVDSLASAIHVLQSSSYLTTHQFFVRSVQCLFTLEGDEIKSLEQLKDSYEIIGGCDLDMPSRRPLPRIYSSSLKLRQLLSGDSVSRYETLLAKARDERMAPAAVRILNTEAIGGGARIGGWNGEQVESWLKNNDKVKEFPRSKIMTSSSATSEDPLQQKTEKESMADSTVEEEEQESEPSADIGRLDVRILAAKHLPNVQTFGLPDPYVTVQVGKKSQRTGKERKSLNPQWNAVFKFFVANPSQQNITFEVWNQNSIKDDFMGKYSFSLSRLYRGVTVEEWLPLQQCQTSVAELHVRICAFDFGLLPISPLVEGSDQERVTRLPLSPQQTNSFHDKMQPVEEGRAHDGPSEAANVINKKEEEEERKLKRKETLKAVDEEKNISSPTDTTVPFLQGRAAPEALTPPAQEQFHHKEEFHSSFNGRQTLRKEPVNSISKHESIEREATAPPLGTPKKPQKAIASAKGENGVCTPFEGIEGSLGTSSENPSFANSNSQCILAELGMVKSSNHLPIEPTRPGGAAVETPPISPGSKKAFQLMAPDLTPMQQPAERHHIIEGPWSCPEAAHWYEEALKHSLSSSATTWYHIGHKTVLQFDLERICMQQKLLTIPTQGEYFFPEKVLKVLLKLLTHSESIEQSPRGEKEGRGKLEEKALKAESNENGNGNCRSHKNNFRLFLIGAKGTGKSSVLSFFLRHIFFPTLGNHQMFSASVRDYQEKFFPFREKALFFVPIHFEYFFRMDLSSSSGIAVEDCGVLFCKWIQHIVELLVLYYPKLRNTPAHQQIVSFWKKVVSQKQPPLFPSSAVEYLTESSLAVEWNALASQLHASFLRCETTGFYEDFIDFMFDIVPLFQRSFQTTSSNIGGGGGRIFYIVDGLDAIQRVMLRDWRRDKLISQRGLQSSSAIPQQGGGLVVNANSAMMQHPIPFLAIFFHHLQKYQHCCSYVMGLEPSTLGMHEIQMQLPTPQEESDWFSMDDFITQEDLRQEKIPTTITANGEIFPVQLFGGAPGYICKFVSLAKEIEKAFNPSSWVSATDEANLVVHDERVAQTLRELRYVVCGY